MNKRGFKWDEGKAASNAAKHGVRFEAARGVFDDPFAIENVDDRQDYGEDRFHPHGMASGRLSTVVYTIRGEAIRIISARGAEPYEQRAYREQNR
jgi:uncharacterized DUF497 family protein